MNWVIIATGNGLSVLTWTNNNSLITGSSQSKDFQWNFNNQNISFRETYLKMSLIKSQPFRLNVLRHTTFIAKQQTMIYESRVNPPPSPECPMKTYTLLPDVSLTCYSCPSAKFLWASKAYITHSLSFCMALPPFCNHMLAVSWVLRNNTILESESLIDNLLYQSEIMAWISNYIW